MAKNIKVVPSLGIIQLSGSNANTSISVTDDGQLQFGESSNTGSLNVTGDLVVQGSVTAQEFKTEFVSASTIYRSGSTKFGDTADDIHSFTGSLSILSGSATINATNTNVLSVNNSANSTAGIVSTNQYLSLNPANYIVLQKTALSYEGIWTSNNKAHRYRETDGTWVDILNLSGTDNVLKFGTIGDVSTGGDIAFYTSGSEKVRITDDGNLAINATSTSGYKLYVNGSTWINGSTNYFDGQTILRTASGATEVMRVASNGNVGIGTTSPTEKLHVVGNIKIEDLNPTIKLLDTNGADWDIQLEDNHLRFKVGSTEYVRFQNGGNVGIGTTSPATKLDVDGTGRITDTVYLSTNANSKTGIGTTSPGTRLDVADSEPIIRLTDTRNLNVGDWDDVSLGRIQFYTSDTTSPGARALAEIQAYSGPGAASGPEAELRFKTSDISDSSAVDRMVIDAQGRVGIGTTSPTQALTVAGNILQTSNSNFIATRKIIGRDSNGLNLTDDSGANGISIKDGGNVQFTDYGSGNNTGTPAYRLSVDSSGNIIEESIGAGAVDGLGSGGYITRWEDTDTITSSSIYENNGDIGIGTTSPAEALDVDGNIVIRDTGTIRGIRRPNDGYNLQMMGGVDPTDGAYLSLGGDTRGGLGNAVAGEAKIVQGGAAYANRAAISSSMLFQAQYNGGSVTDLAIVGSTGNVGIGTTSPAYTLDVDGRIRTSQDLYLDGNYVIKNISSHLYLDAASSSHIIFRPDNGTEKMRITSTGNVGIGTTNPSRKLHVYLDNNDEVARFQSAQSNDVYVEFVNNNSDGASSLGTVNNNFVFSPSGSETVRFTDEGRVGIGTTSPTEELHVVGEARFQGPTYSMSILGGSDLRGSNQLLLRADSSYLRLQASNNNIYHQAGADHLFQDVNQNNLVTIKQAGNVGIGTTSPAELLDVDGTARAASMIAEGVAYAGTGFQHWGDGGTGVNFPANDRIDLDVASTTKIRITNDIDEGILINPASQGWSLGSYNNASTYADIATIINGSTFGGLITGPNSGHLVVRIRNNDNDDSFAVIANSENSASAAPDKVLFRAKSTGQVEIPGDLTVEGIVTAQEFHTEFVSASTIFKSGSTQFGNDSNDTHIFSGSVTQYTSATRYIKLRGGSGDLQIISDNNTTPVAYIKGTGTADLLNVFDNTTEVFTIVDGGNVGIGTTDPQTPLHVNGNISSSRLYTSDDVYVGDDLFIEGNLIRFTGTVTNYIQTTSGDLKLQTALGDDVIIRPGGTDHFIFKDSGRLGIGTTSPSYNLEVSGSIGVKNDLYITHDNGTNPTDAGSLYFKEAGTTWGTNYYGFRINQEGSSNYLNFQSANTTTVKDILTLTRDTARVGIGTTNPGSELEVNGSIEAVGNNAALHLKDSNDDSTKVIFDNLNGNSRVRYYGGNFSFLDEGSTETLTIADSTGNVGIGTTTPASALDVAGDVYVQNNGYLRASGSGALYLGNTNGVVFKLSGDQSDSIIETVSNKMIFQTTRAVDDIEFKVGASAATSSLYIDSTNAYVGIGTTSPSKKLTVIGDAIISGTITGNSNFSVGNDLFINGDKIIFTDDSAAAYVQSADTLVLESDYDSDDSPGGKPILFRVSGDTKMTIDGRDGNVGIGTTNVSARLHLSGSTGSSILRMQSPSANTLAFNHYTGYSTLRDITLSNNRLLFLDSGAITTPYSIGIGLPGTTAPSSDLHIGSNNPVIQIGTLNTSTGNAKLQFYSKNDGTGNAYAIQYTKGTGVDRLDFIDGGGTAKVSFVNGGYVGIGVNNPSDFNSAADNLVVGTGAGTNGITIYSGTNSAGGIYFADESGSGAGNRDGVISYNHSSATMDLKTGGNQRVLSINTGTSTFNLGDVVMENDLTVKGIVTAQEFHTEFVSASIIYQSGSTKFGDTSDDNHDFTGSVNILGPVTATSFTGSLYTTPTTPTNLSLTQEDGTVIVQFTSASGEVHRYEVWSSVGDETNYNLIGALNEDNFTASIQIVDDTFNKNDTVYYTVYSLRNGKYSDSLTGNITVTGNVADVTGMRVMEALHGYHLEWVLPDDNRLQQVNVKVDSSDTLTGLSEANSTTFYSGLAEQTFYEVPEADANKYHQFWIDSITRT